MSKVVMIICIILGISLNFIPNKETKESKDIRFAIKKYEQHLKYITNEQEKRKFWNGYS